jgi:5'-nucleotidase
VIRARTAAILCFVSTLAAGCAARTPTAAATPAIVQVQVLGFNDFHGTLDPPTGSNGRIGETTAGGAAFFAAHAARLRAENPNTIMVSGGDNIGASSLLSGMFHDEPTVESLGDAGLQLSTVGNHEFDEGWDELVRMQTGGCHPVDGCQDKTPFAGARYQYLSANVLVDPSRVDPARLKRSGWRPTGSGPQTLFPKTAIREIGGVKVGFIGLALTSTPTIVQPAMLQGLTFRPEVEAGNEAAAELTAQGVKAIVVMIHAGGRPATADINACEVSGEIVDIAAGLSPAIDVIVSGHSHRSYVCTLSNKLVTSAESLGRLITDVDLDIDRATGEVVAKRARNVIVTRDISRSAAITAILDGYRPFYSTLGNRAVGSITAPLVRKPNEAGESPLGDVVADAILEATAAQANGGASVALWNSGGIRADLMGGTASAPGAPIPVTYSHAFDVLPFGNRVIVRTVTGATLIKMLETGVFQVSRGLSYAFEAGNGRRQRVDPASLTIQGKPVDPAAPIRVATSDFIWSGGDDVVVESTDPLDVGADLDLFIDYLARRSPVAPGTQDRLRRKP